MTKDPILEQNETATAPILQLKHITKVFPGVKALTDVTLDFYPGEVRWELELYDRILSRVMEEVSVGTMLQIISGADFDAILDRINLGLAKTNNIEKAEAMKQQILDKVYIIKKRLMIGEAAD